MANIIRLNFGASPAKQLGELGLSAPKFRGFFAIHPQTAFEPPCFVNGGVAAKMPTTIGAFTLINGGNSPFATSADTARLHRTCPSALAATPLTV